MPKYKTIWTTALPEIFYHLDRSRYYHRDEKLSLPKDAFLAIGERFAAGYTFLLKIINGALVNNVSGTIVARDLYDVLTTDDHLRKWMENKSLELRLNNNFDLSVKVEELEDDTKAWSNAVPMLMANAYGDDEPDYSDVPLMEANPNYKPWTKEQ